MAENTSLWSRLRRSFGSSQAEPWYLADQPVVIRNFFKTFEPLSDIERGLFKHMMEGVKRYRIPLSDQHNIIAQLGDADTLRYLDQIHPNNENGIRKYIAANLRCPEDLAKAYIRDPDPAVRAAAVSCFALEDSFCIDFSYHETDPYVQAALRERLGPSYPFTQSVSNAFAIESFIGRCFEQNAAHPESAVDLTPVLAALRLHESSLLSPELTRDLHEQVASIGDEPVLRSIYSLYPVDLDMLSSLIQNPNCPEDMQESATYWLSEMARPDPTLPDHSNSTETPPKSQFSKPKTQENARGEKPRASLDSLIQNAQSRAMAQAPSSHAPLKTPQHDR